MTDDPAILALLAEARRQYATGLPARVGELEALLAAGSWDDARRAAHKLRGSSGTYGFATLSATAAGIEDALLEAAGPPSEPVLARLRELAREARTQADAAAVTSP
jgi:HPt (histidine-containing phosphotransfer) domain-containing protein